jgi:hypothetical protein
MTNNRLFLVLALAACSNQLPPEPTGGRISGTVTYTGQANQAFARPGLIVSAFFTYPPSGAPHAFATLDMPVGTTMMAYDLRNLPVGDFRIVASAVDLAAATVTGSTDNPTGGYPSMCALTTPAADVPVTADVPVSDINITLFDQGGNADPCYRDTTACPPAGRASLLIELASAAALVAPDKIGYALFPGPASAPVDVLSLAAADVPSFPHTMVRPNLAPGSYLVFVCRDVGGNNPTGCGAEDVSLYYMDKSLLPLTADTITRVHFDLDAATTSLTSITSAAVEGCP